MKLKKLKLKIKFNLKKYKKYKNIKIIPQITNKLQKHQKSIQKYTNSIKSKNTKIKSKDYYYFLNFNLFIK